jgi:hypothetical protein
MNRTNPTHAQPPTHVGKTPLECAEHEGKKTKDEKREKIHSRKKKTHSTEMELHEDA